VVTKVKKATQNVEMGWFGMPGSHLRSLEMPVYATIPYGAYEFLLAVNSDYVVPTFLRYGSVTGDADRRQTQVSKTILAH